MPAIWVVARKHVYIIYPQKNLLSAPLQALPAMPLAPLGCAFHWRFVCDTAGVGLVGVPPGITR